MKKHLYEKMTWPEINQAIEEKRVAVIPIGVIEQHGHHLPVDTDVAIANEFCQRAARLVNDKVVLLQPILHGYSPHQMDFPGTITVKWDIFIKYALDVANSLAYHGFEKILFVNGHGSNIPHVQIIAKLVAIEYPEVICGALSWWDLKDVQDAAAAFRESAYPFGTSHACELETSLYLAIDENLVDMSKASADFNYPVSPHFFDDLLPAPTGEKEKQGFKNNIHLMEWWSTQSKTGTQGDPTVAAKEKGEGLFEAGSRELADIISELKEREIRKRVDHHSVGDKYHHHL